MDDRASSIASESVCEESFVPAETSVAVTVLVITGVRLVAADLPLTAVIELYTFVVVVTPVEDGVDAVDTDMPGPCDAMLCEDGGDVVIVLLLLAALAEETGLPRTKANDWEEVEERTAEVEIVVVEDGVELLVTEATAVDTFDDEESCEGDAALLVDGEELWLQLIDVDCFAMLEEDVVETVLSVVNVC